MGKESTKAPYEIFDSVIEDIANGKIDGCGDIWLTQMEFDIVDSGSDTMHLRYYDVQSLGKLTTDKSPSA